MVERDYADELEELLMEAREQLIWCGGSFDFSQEGQAREGWMKGPQATIEKIDELFPIKVT